MNLATISQTHYFYISNDNILCFMHTTVELLDYNFNQNDGTWSASVIFDIDDYFGLDKKDALVYQAWHDGFGAWWMLQNKKGFVPFHT